MYLLNGSVKYKMKNIDTNEEEEYNLVAGDVVFRTSRIVHGGYFTEDSILIDGSTEVYISCDFNDIREEILK